MLNIHISNLCSTRHTKNVPVDDREICIKEVTSTVGGCSTTQQGLTDVKTKLRLFLRNIIIPKVFMLPVEANGWSIVHNQVKDDVLEAVSGIAELLHGPEDGRKEMLVGLPFSSLMAKLDHIVTTHVPPGTQMEIVLASKWILYALVFPRCFFGENAWRQLLSIITRKLPGRSGAWAPFSDRMFDSLPATEVQVTGYLFCMVIMQDAREFHKIYGAAGFRKAFTAFYRNLKIIIGFDKEFATSLIMCNQVRTAGGVGMVLPEAILAFGMVASWVAMQTTNSDEEEEDDDAIKGVDSMNPQAVMMKELYDDAAESAAAMLASIV